ncbi:MAG TPA: NUDIX domain-containing protein [Nitrososphaerales archaeon]|nr:NUDIX domain-containing protein [Nitrososphaerales archaeon]
MPAVSSELVDVVDEEDVKVGTRPLRECLELGLLHRAVAVLVFDKAGRVLIQKRSKDKAWYPGFWTLSATGHVRSGETYAEAAERELREEAGITCELGFVSKFLDARLSRGGLTEWEYVGIFEGRHSGPASPDGVEVETFSYVEFERLVSPAPGLLLTPDAVAVAKEFVMSGVTHSGSD